MIAHQTGEELDNFPADKGWSLFMVTRPLYSLAMATGHPAIPSQAVARGCPNFTCVVYCILHWLVLTHAFPQSHTGTVRAIHHVMSDSKAHQLAFQCIISNTK